MARFKFRRFDRSKIFEDPDPQPLAVWGTHTGIACSLAHGFTDVFVMDRAEARRFAEYILELTTDE